MENWWGISSFLTGHQETKKRGELESPPRLGDEEKPVQGAMGFIVGSNPMLGLPEEPWALET